jgi:diguanylate cyclase (GGDEF)-like protein/PAS domain S-box-containing protein
VPVHGCAVPGRHAGAPGAAMSVARLPGSRYLALAVLAALPALALVAGDSRLPVPGYLPLHQVLEAVSIFVAFAVFATVWVVHTDRTPGSTLVVACALLAAGLLDVAHVLTFVGMPDLIAESGPQATLYFWLCARFAATAGLLVAALRPSLPFRRPQARYGVLAITLAGTLLLLWVGVRHVDALPLLFDEARGLTRTKVLAELSIIALLLTAAVLYRRRIGSDGSMDASGLFMASTVSILSGLCFVDYAQLTEPMTLIGHALKAIAYGYIFRAVFVSTVRAPVTHLREAQRSLEQRERQLRSSSRLAQATLDSLPEHVCVIDGNGVIVAVNRAWRQFALRNGTAPARVSEGVNYLAVCELAQGPGAEEARRLATEMRALLGGHAGTFRIEYPCHSLTEQRWFAMRANRFADTGETLVVVAHADITQNKLAETALRDNEARLAGIVGQAMDAVITVDESYRVVLFNQAAAAMFGCDPAEAIGRPVEDFVPERFRATHAGHTRDFALSGDSSTTMGRFGEIVALRANGEEIPVEASVSRVSVRGRLLFTVVMRDITERKRAQKAVLDAMARLEDAQRIGRIGDWTLEIATGAMTWSPQVFEMLELDPAAGVPTLASTMALCDAPTRETMRRKIDAAVASGHRQEYELRLRLAGGRVVYLGAVAMPRRDADGCVRWLDGTVQDITARKRDEQALQRQMRCQALAAQFGRFALASTDLQQVFQRAADVVCEGLEVQYSKVLKRVPDSRTPMLAAGNGWAPGWVGRRLPRSEGAAQDFPLAAGEPAIVDDYRAETRVKRPAILRRHGILSGIRVLIGGPDAPGGMLGAFAKETHRFQEQDLSFMQTVAGFLETAILRTSNEEKLARLAQYDALTELPNRLLLRDRVEVAIENAERSGASPCLMFVDLDRFKLVNDSFGHATGDRLLREVASRLSRAIRGSDTVSRQGGDEFLVLLPELDAAEAAGRIAGKLIAEVARPYRIDGRELLIGASIGIACFPGDGSDYETLLRNADAAMYSAKDLGRGRYQFYSPEMNGRAQERLVLESELRKAVEREQLLLHYQPQFSTGDGRVIGVEALLRWQHPSRGLVPPGQFVPVAEETGLIIAIGNWVLEHACRQRVAWQREGIDAGVLAVNVSAPQFRQPDFVAVVTAALERTGLDPALLELEVTESVVMQGLDSVRAKLDSLKALGVKFAIDDFGTGYSSLSYLRQLPINRLKLDQSFVRGLPDDRGSAAISQAVVSMGRSLDLEVIAEGVETERQVDYLKSIGCSLVQGFLLARPLPVNDCARFLRRPGAVPAARRAAAAPAGG